MKVKKKAKGILLIDEHPIIRDAIALTLSRDPDLQMVGWSKEPGQAIALLAKEPPDLVLMEIALNGGNGIELIKRMVAQDPQIPILVLSQHDEDLYAERSFRAGAKGFITKKSEAAEILVAIQTVLKGKHYFSSSISTKLWDKVWTGNSEKEKSPVETLTDRELQVLELIGKGTKTSAIAELLGISMKTVETYRGKLKEKFDLRDGAQLARHAVEWVSQQAK
ncbi:MAG: DNA-binding response regulator [Verrucomicrobiales bacterium]|nr:DNA-binding response regulator [Verrucomicrobiales bacterium]